MILRQSHTTIFVLDYEEALVFYRDLMGFDVRMDMTTEEGFRWVTIGPPAQPDLHLILVEPRAGPMLEPEAAEQIRDLVRRGAFGIGVFETDDCKAMYESLKRKGVQFLTPPTERFYGLEALVRDNSGNWFSLTERKV